MLDTVHMPKFEAFHNAEFYYSTFFHELAHSTGHATRLNRDEIVTPHKFGTPEYSKEELVAELCAAMLCGVCAIENVTIDNNSAYIKSWLEVLKNDRRLIVDAAAKAQKAADFILGKSGSGSTPAQEPAAAPAEVIEDLPF